MEREQPPDNDTPRTPSPIARSIYEDAAKLAAAYHHAGDFLRATLTLQKMATETLRLHVESTRLIELEGPELTIPPARFHCPACTKVFHDPFQCCGFPAVQMQTVPAPAPLCPRHPSTPCQGDYGVPMRCEWCDRLMEKS